MQSVGQEMKHTKTNWMFAHSARRNSYLIGKHHSLFIIIIVMTMTPLQMSTIYIQPNEWHICSAKENVLTDVNWMREKKKRNEFRCECQCTRDDGNNAIIIPRRLFSHYIDTWMLLLLLSFSLSNFFSMSDSNHKTYPMLNIYSVVFLLSYSFIMCYHSDDATASKYINRVRDKQSRLSQISFLNVLRWDAFIHCRYRHILSCNVVTSNSICENRFGL